MEEEERKTIIARGDRGGSGAGVEAFYILQYLSKMLSFIRVLKMATE